MTCSQVDLGHGHFSLALHGSGGWIGGVNDARGEADRCACQTRMTAVVERMASIDAANEPMSSAWPLEDAVSCLVPEAR